LTGERVVENEPDAASRSSARSLTRRAGLITGLVAAPLAATAGSAIAQPKHTARTAGGHKTKEAAVPTGSPAETPLGPVDTAARWAYAVDFDTGATLLEKAADEEMPPSSMTKLMTMYIVYDRLAQGRLKLDDQLPVSEKAWRMQGSKMFVQVGSTVPVEDLIRGVIVQSGNDAATVLAEAIGGSEEQFVELMNKTAQKLGLTHSFFKNCTGWPDPDQHMSSRDIATLAADIIRTFPQYYHYDSEKSFKYDGIDQGNRNPMVQRGTADGLKTGHTEAGGYGLVVSSKRNGRRVILVLNGMTSMRERAEESERLMDWAFFNFEDVTLFTAGDVIETVPVWLGTQKTVPLVAGRNLIVTMPRNWRQKASVKVAYDAPLTAPISKGDTLGKLIVSGEGVPNMTVPLLAAADVGRLGLPGRAMAVLSKYMTGT
jgi:D-alanyl-D-alanine carboxypeptidase (penicillin-binding protein 5/6)